MEAIKTINLKNNTTLKIFIDYDPENPRNYDNVSTFYCFHRSYNLGDQHDIDHNDYNSFKEMVEENFNLDDIVLPLFLYDHSGITISTRSFSCVWDSGQIGFAVITKEQIIKEFGEYNGRTKQSARLAIEREVEIYDRYLRGDVYRYETSDGRKIIDEVGGYYSIKDIIGEFKRLI